MHESELVVAKWSDPHTHSSSEPFTPCAHRKIPDRNRIAASARLLSVCLCRGEIGSVVDGIYGSLKAAWNVLAPDNAPELKPQYVISDHSTTLRAATKRAFPEAVLLDCYPHVMRNVWKNEGGVIQGQTRRGETTSVVVEKWKVLGIVKRLRRAVTFQSFVELWQLAKDELTAMGHDEFAERFEATYIDVEGGFSLAHSTIPVSEANNNPHEALNRNLKHEVLNLTRTLLEVLLTKKLPSLFKLPRVSQKGLTLEEV